MTFLGWEYSPSWDVCLSPCDVIMQENAEAPAKPGGDEGRPN